jgi:NitT/TauT family transport system substrate-binding protein
MARVGNRWAWIGALGLSLILGCTTSAPAGGGAAAPRPPATTASQAAGAAPATTAPAAPAEARTPLKLKVGQVPGTPTSGIYLAMARGYFAEEGLEVDTEPFDAGERTIPALATGQIEISASGLSAGLYGAIARGAELKVVAGMTSNEPGFSSSAAVVRKDLADAGAIREVPDLRGRTAGLIAPSTSFAIDASRALRGAGMSDDDVNWTILSFSDQVSALANGAIDVAFITEPFVARTVQTGIGVRWKGMDEFAPYHQLTVVMYNPDFVREHPDAARRWLVAYLRGARDFADAFRHGRDKAGVIRVLIEHTPIKDPALYEVMVPSGIDPDGGLNQESMEYDQDWYLSRGFTREKIDLGRVVDLSYRDAALQQIGRYQPRP